MIYLTQTPLDIKTTTCLHLVHPKEMNSPKFIVAKNHVKAQSQWVAKIGEAIFTQARFLSYETIIVHDITDTYFFDGLKKLSFFNYPKFLARAIKDTVHSVVFYGNSIKYLGEKVTFIPDKAIVNGSYTSSTVDIATKGLGIFPHIRLDVDVKRKLDNPNYKVLISRLARTETVYGLDGKVIYIHEPPNKPYIRYGEMFIAKGGDFEILKEIPTFIDDEQNQAQATRDIDKTANTENTEVVSQMVNAAASSSSSET